MTPATANRATIGSLNGCLIASRLLLMAVTLCFRHPLSDVPMRLTSELDPPFTRVVHGMAWSEVLAERLMAADGDK